jgi:hypothetical protein
VAAIEGAPHGRARDVDAAGAAARLTEVAAEGGPVEVILVVRGTIRPVEGSGGRRWRMRLDSDHVLSFRAEWVVATRPAGRPQGD